MDMAAKTTEELNMKIVTQEIEAKKSVKFYPKIIDDLVGQI